MSDVEVVLVRGPPPGPRWRVVTFKASVELVERLDALAERLGKSRSDVIREALEHYLRLARADAPGSRYVRLGELLDGVV